MHHRYVSEGDMDLEEVVDNVRSEKNNTKLSSNTLLYLVLFFSERTLDPQKRFKFWILDLKVCMPKRPKHWVRLVWKKCHVICFY